MSGGVAALANAADAISVAESDGPVPTGRIITATVIGTVLEWYDLLIQGTAAAPVFGQLFFP